MAFGCVTQGFISTERCVFQDYTVADTPETRAQMLADEARPSNGKKRTPKARAPPVRRIIQGMFKEAPKACVLSVRRIIQGM